MLRSSPLPTLSRSPAVSTVSGNYDDKDDDLPTKEEIVVSDDDDQVLALGGEPVITTDLCSWEPYLLVWGPLCVRSTCSNLCK